MMQQHQQRSTTPDNPTVGSYEPATTTAPSPYDKPSSTIPVPMPPSAKKPTAYRFAPTEVSVPAPSSKDKFRGMIDRFRRKVIGSMDEVTCLSQHRSGLLEEQFVTAVKERLAAQQKLAAEHQQMAAAEAEDYQMAD
jgi:hypothetical protein